MSTLSCGCAQVYRILYTYILLRTLCACWHVLSCGETHSSVPSTCTNTIMALWKSCYRLGSELVVLLTTPLRFCGLFFFSVLRLWHTIDAFYRVCNYSLIAVFITFPRGFLFFLLCTRLQLYFSTKSRPTIYAYIALFSCTDFITCYNFIFFSSLLCFLLYSLM